MKNEIVKHLTQRTTFVKKLDSSKGPKSDVIHITMCSCHATGGHPCTVDVGQGLTGVP